MIRRPPRSTRTDTLFPYTTLFRSDTFELISMLYGQIEEEIRSDAPGAALIRRLQLPLLRVALQDRAFFVRGHHPARRLLNTVAESARSEEHTSELQSLMRHSYAVFCLKHKKKKKTTQHHTQTT